MSYRISRFFSTCDCHICTYYSLQYCRKLHQKDVSKYHIQLSIALLCMYITSLALVVLSAERVANIYGGCLSVSVLVHYFTLVAVMWMGAEALLMFQKLVIVFVQLSKKYIATVSVICWSKLCTWLVYVTLAVEGSAIESYIMITHSYVCSCTYYSCRCFSHCGSGKWKRPWRWHYYQKRRNTLIVIIPWYLAREYMSCTIISGSITHLTMHACELFLSILARLW